MNRITKEMALQLVKERWPDYQWRGAYEIDVRKEFTGTFLVFANRGLALVDEFGMQLLLTTDNVKF